MFVPPAKPLARLRSLAVAAAVATGAVAACYSGPDLNQGYFGVAGDGGSSGSACTPDIASIQSTIFGPSCTQSGCHNAVERAAGLDLSASNVEAQLVGQASTCQDTILVVPGSPDTSNLYQKIAGTKPNCGDPMPLGAATLSQADRDCIKQWITTLTPGSVDGGADAAGCGDTQTSPTDCGKCGNVCATGAACVAGYCTCPAGESTVCASSCVDTQSDAMNCGACGTVCGGATPFCSQGTCSASCTPNTLTPCPDGSCVDTTSSFSNCGACGTACKSGQLCTDSACACPNGSILCGGTCVANDTTSNCGTCGNACSPGQACTGGTCSCGTASVSFAAAVQPIFTTTCATAGCHTKGAGGMLPMGVQGLDLSAGSAYANTVNVDAKECTDARVRVKPMAPTESYLMQKLLNVNLCGNPSTQMPKKGVTLPPADLVTIGNWICAGAPNN